MTDAVTLAIGTFTYLFIARFTSLSAFPLLNPMVAGAFAGWLVGDLSTGLLIGASIQLMALGVMTYGGAAIPAYGDGAILGTIFSVTLGLAPEVGVAVAIPVMFALTPMKFIAMSINLVWLHAIDRFAEDLRFGMMDLCLLLGAITWGVVFSLPATAAVLIGVEPAVALFAAIPEWFTAGITTAGKIYPALGFALITNMLAFDIYWPFLIAGFVLVSIFGSSIIANAIIGVVVGMIYVKLMKGK